MLDFQPTGKSFKVSTSIETLSRMSSSEATHAVVMATFFFVPLHREVNFFADLQATALQHP